MPTKKFVQRRANLTVTWWEPEDLDQADVERAFDSVMVDLNCRLLELGVAEFKSLEDLNAALDLAFRVLGDFPVEALRAVNDPPTDRNQGFIAHRFDGCNLLLGWMAENGYTIVPTP